MATKPSAPQTTYRVPLDVEVELRRALDEADRGEFLDEATTEAYLRWLETGEGPCPCKDESSD